MDYERLSVGVLPASAGMILPAAECFAELARAPRIRRDDPLSAVSS